MKTTRSMKRSAKPHASSRMLPARRQRRPASRSRLGARDKLDLALLTEMITLRTCTTRRPESAHSRGQAVWIYVMDYLIRHVIRKAVRSCYATEMAAASAAAAALQILRSRVNEMQGVRNNLGRHQHRHELHDNEVLHDVCSIKTAFNRSLIKSCTTVSRSMITYEKKDRQKQCNEHLTTL